MKGIPGSLLAVALICAGLLLSTGTPLFAEGSEPTTTAEPAGGNTLYLPLAQYDYLSLDSRVIHSPGAGLLVLSGESLFVGLYTRHTVEKKLPADYPDLYHALELVYDGRTNRHQYLAAFKSVSDQPVYGGLHTVQAAAVYGYEVISRDRLSLALGGGIAVGDFGIELSNGRSWPILPVPFIRMGWESRLLEASFEFITGPNLRATLAPESRLRLHGEMRMDEYRDIQDLIFESSLEYRLLSPDSPLGDLAGVSLGVKNDHYGFALGRGGREVDDNGSFEVGYYAYFASLDLSLLKITGGYAFEGRERYGDSNPVRTGDGYFLSIQGMIPIQGK
ncbi:MAG: hypothetical protein EA427_00760 [Spirochaetaceae bacterium]|nr:MAG: hypothetical protein EA427_00760 [Spirochaetaceae bacterium]